MTATAAKTKRIIGLDIARAFAIVGMVIVNFNVVMSSGVSEPGWLRFFAVSLEGRAAATFVVLAGIGASLGSRRARESGEAGDRRRARTTLARRALFLFVIGWLFFPIWPADILHFYGVYLALGSLLLFAPNRALLWWGAAATAVSFGFIVTADYFANWNLDDLSYEGLNTVSGFLRNLFLDGLHPVLPWIAFYLFGMWLGRTDLRDPAWRRRIVVRAAGILVVVEGVAWAVLGPKGSRTEELGDEAWQWLFSVEMLPPMPLYLVAGTATACLVIVGSIWLGDHASARVTTPLVHTGQLALTLYVAHVVVGMGILETMGRLEDQSLVFIVISSLAFCAAAIAWSTWWRRRHQRGPLEWVMRRLAG
ncbi:MAG: DUF418 domain-containing protein [Acidimicrobiia bacterium]|nr:DUF418 domain-containing protein [Acidimicrobiia bacterium]